MQGIAFVCKIKLSIIILIDLYFIRRFFFRTPMSALTGSLLLSSSFRETYFRTTHCLPRSELIATPVYNALILDGITFVAKFLYSSAVWCKIVTSTSH